MVDFYRGQQYVQKGAGRAQITICPRGRIRINTVLTGRMGEGWHFCLIKIEDGKLWLKMTQDDEQCGVHAIRLAHSGKGKHKTSLSIAAREALEWFKYNRNETTTYLAKWDPSTKCVMADLTRPMTPDQARRANPNGTSRGEHHGG